MQFLLRTLTLFVWCISFGTSAIAGDEPLSLPVSRWFVPNAGQIIDINKQPVPDVLYLLEQPQMQIYLTTRGLTYVFLKSLKTEEEDEEHEPDAGLPYEGPPRGEDILQYERFDLELRGAQINPANIDAAGEAGHTYNFYKGTTGCAATGIKAATRLTVKQVYPGIDWILYTDDKTFTLKYDFVVHPGADASQIRLLHRGLQPLTLSDPKTMHITTALGNLSDEIPLAYAGTPDQVVDVTYSVAGQQRVEKNGMQWYETMLGFDVGNYARNERLVIDPAQLSWGSYFGGNNNCRTNVMQVDYNYDLVIAGSTADIGFPLLNPGNNAYFTGTISSTFQETFIAKFDSSRVLKWCTYYGGDVFEDFYAMAVTPSNDVLLCGYTNSTTLVTVNPGGGAYYQPANAGNNEGLLLRFSPAGVLEWGTYVGSSTGEKLFDIEVVPSGAIYVSGSGGNAGLPVTGPPGSYQQAALNSSDGFVMRFTPAGVVDWLTYFGGTGTDNALGIEVDQLGQVYISGITSSNNLPVLQSANPNAFYQPAFAGQFDFYFARFTPALALDWCTYLGGTANELNACIMADQQNRIYISGNSLSAGFPLVNPGGNAYFASTSNGNIIIACFSDSLELEWSTRMNNIKSNQISPGRIGMALGSCGNVFVGSTYYGSTSMLLNPGNGAYYVGTAPGGIDLFIAEFNANHELAWGTYFGGTGTDDGMCMTTDQAGYLYVAGDGGGLGYFNQPDYSTFQGNCHLNPGNGAYYQSVPLITNMDYNYIAAFRIQGAIQASQVTATSPNCPNFNDGSITLTPQGGQGNFSIVWQPSGSNAFTLNNLSPGNYSYTLTDAGGCTTTGVVTLVGYQEFNVNVTATNLIICEGQSTTLTATGAPGTVTWNPPAGNGNTITVSPTTSTTYVATYTNGNGCPSSDSVLISVNPLATVQISCPDTVCMGVPTTIAVSGNSFTDWYNNMPATNPMIYTFANDTVLIAYGSSGPLCPVVYDTVSVTVIDCGGVGLNEEVVPGLRVWPNPAGALVNLELPGNELWNVEVYDAQGKRIVNTNLRGPKAQLPCAGWSDGNYLVRISKGEQMHHVKLVKTGK